MPIPDEKPPRGPERRPRTDEDLTDQDPDESAEFDRGSRTAPDEIEPADEDDELGWPDRVRQA